MREVTVLHAERAMEGVGPREGKSLTLGHKARQSPGGRSQAMSPEHSRTFQNIHVSTRGGFPNLDIIGIWAG